MLLAQSFDIVVLDQYGLDDFQVTGLLPEYTCKLRLIDAWGTPPEQNHMGLQLHQFWVLNPNPWNYWIGFAVDESLDPMPRPPRKPQILLWGKQVTPVSYYDAVMKFF